MTQEITVVRTFDAPRELVWDTATKAENFAVWFGTEAVSVPLETLVWDAAAGHRWSAIMQLPDGSTKPWVGEFVEVDPPSRFIFTLTDVPEAPEDATPVTITLVSVGEGTELTLTSPQGWGGDVIPGGQAGYMNTPSIEDEIKAVRFVTTRQLTPCKRPSRVT